MRVSYSRSLFNKNLSSFDSFSAYFFVSNLGSQRVFVSFFFIISFVLLKPGSRETRRRRRRVFCCDVVESDFDASAEKTDGGEIFFVGCDREVRRYLFHAYLAEIESNGS